MHPLPDPCRRPCFTVRVRFREKKCGDSNSRTFKADYKQKQQDTTPQNAECQHSTAYQYAAVTNQKKGMLNTRDEGKSLTYQCSDDSTYESEQRACRFPPLLSNREATEVAEGSAQQAWCQQRVCRFPPSVENRDSVRFTEDSQNSANQLEQSASLPHFQAD